jgi:hypothetical protein
MRIPPAGHRLRKGGKHELGSGQQVYLQVQPARLLVELGHHLFEPPLVAAIGLAESKPFSLECLEI